MSENIQSYLGMGMINIIPISNENREKIAQRSMGVPFMVHPLLYNRGKEVAVMEQNNGKMCSMCGKKFDMWDEQEDFCIE